MKRLLLLILLVCFAVGYKATAGDKEKSDADKILRRSNLFDPPTIYHSTTYPEPFTITATEAGTGAPTGPYIRNARTAPAITKLSGTILVCIAVWIASWSTRLP